MSGSIVSYPVRRAIRVNLSYSSRREFTAVKQLGGIKLRPFPFVAERVAVMLRAVCEIRARNVEILRQLCTERGKGFFCWKKSPRLCRRYCELGSG